MKSTWRAGPPATEGIPPVGSHSADGLLDVAGTGRAVDIYLPPGVLDDLHDPSLIITPGYVGPERRDRARRYRIYRSKRALRRPGHGLRLIEVVAVVLATVAAAVPFTLIASHSMVEASAARAAPSNPTAEATGALRASGAAVRQHHSGRLGLRPVRLAANRRRIATGPAVAVQPRSASCTLPGNAVRTARCSARLARTDRQEQRASLRATRASLRAARVSLRATRASQRASKH